MEILLDNQVFKIVGELIPERVTVPLIAQVGSGDIEDKDFTGASRETWVDLRGGIGLKKGRASEGRVWWSEGLTYLKDFVTLGPLVSIAGAFAVADPRIIDFGGGTYAYAHNKIAKWNTGTSAWDTKKADFANPTDAVIYTDDSGTYLCICNGANIIYSADGETWTALDPAEVVSKLAVFERCLRGINSAGTSFRDSPVGDIDGTWGGFKLYEDYSQVNDLFAGKLVSDGSPILYITTPEGLWAINPWSMFAAKQDINFALGANAGKAGAYWNAKVWIASGAGLATQDNNGADLDAGPNADDGLPSGFQGYIADILNLTRWIIVALDGGANNKSSIFRKHCTIGNWQQIYTTSEVNKSIKHLHFSPSTLYSPGRLWFSEGTDVKYLPFPDDTDDITEVSGYTYTATGYDILPVFDYLPLVPKIALAVEAITKDCTATEKVTISYRINDNVDWTELGSFTTSPAPNPLTFGDSAGLEFYSIQFKRTFARGGTNTNRPILEKMSLVYYPAPDPLLAWQFIVMETGDDSQAKLSLLKTTMEKKVRIKFSPDGDYNKSAYWVVAEDRPFDRTMERSKLEGTMTCRIKQIYGH